MPNEIPEPLDWNEANFSKVVSELYMEAATNLDLRRELIATPFDVLRQRINIPEDYRGGVFVREKTQRTMVLHIPAYEEISSRGVLPEETSEDAPDYEIVCTTITEW